MTYQSLLMYAGTEGIPWVEVDYDTMSERVYLRRDWLCRNARHAIHAGRRLFLGGSELTETSAIEAIMRGEVLEVRA